MEMKARDLVLTAPVTLLLAAGCAAPDIAGSGYDAASPRHVAARTAADTRTRAQLDAMVPTGTLLGESRYDACFEYQRNWKIRDPNRIECHLHLTRAVAVANIVEGIRKTARRFAAAGCPNNAAFEDSLRYYTDVNGTNGKERYRRNVDLPQVLFDCGDARVQAQFINPGADMLEQDLANIDSMIGARRVALVEQRGYDAAEVAAARGTRAPLVVLVAIDHRYHAEHW